MNAREQEARLRAEQARRVALFRYELIQDVIDPALSTRQRGPMVRALAAREHVPPRTPAEVLDLAAAVKKENLGRTAAQVARILRAQSGWSPSERTLQRHFERLELHAPAPSPVEVFGRFEAARPNEIWTGDALHGPLIAGRKTYLFAFLDDHSRAA